MALAAFTAGAEPARALTDGRRLVQSFEYEAAVGQLRPLLDDPAATARQRVEALELLAVVHFELGQLPEARRTFQDLLGLDPAHELTDPAYPPRFREFFIETRGAFVPRTEVDVEVTAPESFPESEGEGEGDGGAVVLEAAPTGSTAGVDRAVAFVRAGSSGDFSQLEMRRDGDLFTVDVPVPADGRELQFYVELHAPSGTVLARRGSSTTPRIIVPRAADVGGAGEGAEGIEPAAALASAPDPGSAEAEVDAGRPERRSWYRSWWFWTIVGAVVAGGVTTAVVLAVPEEYEGAHGSLGHFDLP